jgi:predicted short-subunit dehydrogenase-like oxidoreductase (DUF2520 family)
MAIESVHVIGSGRVGSAVSARLRERGIELRTEGADLVLLCVPDAAIAEVARDVGPGPWIAHTSGGTPLSALDPHRRRFSVHPLQTFVLERGPEQLDGAWAAVSGKSDEALEQGFRLAETLGLRPFELADADRPLYHAGAVFAASFLVTLHEAAAELLSTAGAPPEALEPLMRRTIENGFQPTGPFIRGDRGTIERNLAAIHERRPELEPLYRHLAAATEELVAR